jgi:hypothetical protein
VPIWLMFIPIAAIIQGIIVLFVALGQWITGTYYALAPHDGNGGGRIEIVRAENAGGPMRIEARLADGRLFSATFRPSDRRAIVRSAPSREPALAFPSIAIELYASDGSAMQCRFTRSANRRDNGGRCETPDGRGFDVIAVAPPPVGTPADRVVAPKNG